MEQFKAVEKEMKTKAYSKEGLSAGGRLDPREKDKVEMCDFLSNCVEEIQRKIESFEAEQETLHVQLKKSKKDTGKSGRLADVEHLSERHKWHLNKLELLLRSVENGTVNVNDMAPVKDSIKYYVEDGANSDYMGEDETLYDDLDLGGEAEAQFGLAGDNEHGSSQDAQSAQEEEAGEPKAKPKADAQGTRRPSTQMKSPLPVLATLHPAGSSPSTTSMKPAPPPARQPGETLKYASAAAAAAASDKNGVGIAPLPPPPSASPAFANVVPSSRTPTSTASPSVSAAQPAVARTVAEDEARPKTPAQTAAQAAASANNQTNIADIPTKTAAEAAATPTVEQQQQQQRQQSSPAPPPTANGEPTTKEDEEPVESIFHLPPGLQDLVQSFEATKNRASTNPPPAVQRLIATSLTTCPEPLDAEKPRHYKPQNPYNTPLYYPQEPIAVFDDPRLYDTGRIDTDTLFYLFYYRQGTYQQYLAAQALKSQSWRFHKQYQTWFQRHEEPKTITEEFEQGTYRFFDYESTW